MEKQLYTKLFKCEFWLDRVTFSRHMALTKGITMNPSKIKVVLNWLRPKIFKEFYSLLGLLGYYKRFVGGLPS